MPGCSHHPLPPPTHTPFPRLHTGYGYKGRMSQACDQGSYNPGDNYEECKPCPFGYTTTGVGIGKTAADCLSAPGYGPGGLCPIGGHAFGPQRVEQATWRGHGGLCQGAIQMLQTRPMEPFLIPMIFVLISQTFLERLL